MKGITLGTIVLASVIGFSGCDKNIGVEYPEKVGRVGDAQVIYGTTSWTNSRSGLFSKDKKMLVKYDNGLTLEIYAGNKDGRVNMVNATLDEQRAQEIYDYIKSQLK